MHRILGVQEARQAGDVSQSNVPGVRRTSFGAPVPRGGGAHVRIAPVSREISKHAEMSRQVAKLVAERLPKQDVSFHVGG